MPRPTNDQLEKLLIETRTICEALDCSDLILPIANSMARYAYLRSEILTAHSLDELEIFIEELVAVQENRIHDVAELRTQKADEEVERVLLETRRNSADSEKRDTDFDETIHKKIADSEKSESDSDLDSSAINVMRPTPDFDLSTEKGREAKELYESIVASLDKANDIKFDWEEIAAVRKELSSLNSKISSLLTSTQIFIAELPLRELDSFHFGELKKSIFDAQLSLNSWRKWRKRHYHIFRFVLAAFLAGFVASVAVSNLPKFFTDGLTLFVLAFIITFVYSIVREYFIAPYVRKVILERRRKYLLANLEEFRKLDLTLMIMIGSEEFELAKDMSLKTGG